MDTEFIDLQLIDYKKAWDYQEECLAEIVNKKDEGTHAMNKVLLCEHPHVYTLGKSGQKNNLLINSEFLKKIDATYYEINRGGDITYHGPGQLVGYPIINLDSYNIGAREYIFRLEEAIIKTLEQFGINASRLEGATGVWLDTNKPATRKICAIGVRISKGVTMHGFALNVNTKLNYFTHINPCGLQDKGVTSIEKEVGSKQDMGNVKITFARQFAALFNLPLPTLETKSTL